jgi:hypothetical protein
MALDPESIYRQLGRLLAAPPDSLLVMSTKKLEWLARVRALVAATGDIEASAQFSMGMAMLSAPGSTMKNKEGEEQLLFAAYSALASAELKAPAGVKGAFIPASNSFDAFAALAKVLESAKQDVMIVDPYLDETALTEFGGIVPAGVTYRLLSDKASHKPTLQVAAGKWQAQHGGARPLAVRLAGPRTLHDRAIFVDKAVAWILTQSLKDFAKHSPAEIVRADDTANLKIHAYEKIWETAEVVI